SAGIYAVGCHSPEELQRACLNSRPAQAHGSGDVGYPLSLVLHVADRPHLHIADLLADTGLRAAPALAGLTRPCLPGLYPLAAYFSFVLGDRSQDVRHQPAGWGR